MQDETNEIGKTTVHVDQRQVYTALRELVRVPPHRKNTLPILDYVHLEATGAGTLTLTCVGGDLEYSLSCRLLATGNIHTCLPAKLLVAAVKPANRRDNCDLSITQQGTNASVCAGKFGASIALPVQDPTEFPEMQTVEAARSRLVTWSSTALRQALAFVLPAAERDRTRKGRCCVRFRADCLVTTDGHRLHWAPLQAQAGDFTNCSIPQSAITTLLRLLDSSSSSQVTLARDRELLQFRVGNWQLDTRCVDEPFPDYRRIILDTQLPHYHGTVDAVALTEILTRLGQLVTSKQVELNLADNVLTLTAIIDDDNQNTTKFTIPLHDTDGGGAGPCCTYNLNYLLDTLVGGGSVTLRFFEPDSPLRVDLKGGASAYIMPIRP